MHPRRTGLLAGQGPADSAAELRHHRPVPAGQPHRFRQLGLLGAHRLHAGTGKRAFAGIWDRVLGRPTKSSAVRAEQVLGRNCRFLQGPDTDPNAVAKIRKSIADGSDASVCLLNYRRDGSTFWNQFFIAPLRDVGGRVVNYIGVSRAVLRLSYRTCFHLPDLPISVLQAQCKVSDDFARGVVLREAPSKSSAAGPKLR